MRVPFRLGVEERSDEAPRAGRARPTPDPAVVAKPKRRQFTAQYRLRILEEAERCTQPGEVDRRLRREELYSSPTLFQMGQLVVLSDLDGVQLLRRTIRPSQPYLESIQTIPRQEPFMLKFPDDDRNGPRELDSAVSEIFLGFQAAKSR